MMQNGNSRGGEEQIADEVSIKSSHPSDSKCPSPNGHSHHKANNTTTTTSSRTSDPYNGNSHHKANGTDDSSTKPSNETIHSSLKSPPLDSPMAQSPIAKCILTGNHRLLLECLAQGENPSMVCANSGRCYLHLIAQAATTDRELTWVPMVYLLSNAGADMNHRDLTGMAPCTIAISKKHVQMLSALMKCGAEIREADWFQAEQTRGVVKAEMLEIMRRLSPSYWSAVQDLTHFKVNRLVKAWARINVSRNGQSLIEYAKQVAKEEMIVKLLLHHEASIELAHAVMAGDRDRVRTLLCDNAVDLSTSDTSVKNNSFEPIAPLTLNGAAIKLGHVDVLNELIAAKDRQKSVSMSNASMSGYSSTSDAASFTSSSRGRYMQGINPDSAVVFYKGSSNEEVCQIRTQSKPVTSAMCVIL